MVVRYLAERGISSVFINHRGINCELTTCRIYCSGSSDDLAEAMDYI